MENWTQLRWTSSFDSVKISLFFSKVDFASYVCVVNQIVHAEVPAVGVLPARITMEYPSQHLALDKDWQDDVNLCDRLIFENLRRGRGNSIALLYQGNAITYQALSELVLKGTAFLRQNNVGPEDRILLLVRDTPAFVTIFFSALHLGAIVVPVNPYLEAEDVRKIAVRVGPKLIFIDNAMADKFAGLSTINSTLLQVGDCVGKKAQFEELLNAIPVVNTEPYHKQDATAYCLFSSGTTGEPKGIPHRHCDILECILAYSLPTLSMTETDRVLAVPKLTFGYGLGGNLLSAFYVGGTAILLPEPSSRESILRAAQQYKPTLFLGQPRLIADLVHAPLEEEAFEHLRLAVTAGEVLAPTLYDKWRSKLNIELLDGFGSTEIGHVFISNHVGDVRPGCAGRVLRGFAVKIIDDMGNSVETDKVGHLWVSGPSLARGYWNDPERTQLHFQDGWVRTGDLFRCDAEGYLHSCGRADDMIKAGCGQWVAPLEIEALLFDDPAVADCAVVGYSDDDGVVRPKAFVQLRPGERPGAMIEERLKRAVKERWPESVHKHLGTVTFVTSLPRSSTGKLQRFRLRPATLTEFAYEC